VYKKKNQISSYKIAKTQFVKELEYSVWYDVMNDPEYSEICKQNLKNHIKKE